MNKEGFHGETIFRKKTDNQGEAFGGRALRACRSTGSTGPRRLFLRLRGRGGGEGDGGGVGRESALHLESGGLALRPWQT